MIKRLLTTFAILLLIGVPVHASEAASGRRYLVAFSTDNGHGMPRYLMEIDRSGRILRSPRKITEPSGKGQSTVGLLQTSSGTLILWLRHRQNILYALELDPRTWKLLARRKTSMETFYSVDAGQDGGSAFLTAGSPNGEALSFPITRHGISIGKPLRLSTGLGFFAGISTDGRASIFSSDPGNFGDPAKLLFRTLNAAGQLTGPQRVIADRDSRADVSFLWPADVTNLLSGNKRLVAYVEVPNSEFIGETLFARTVPSGSGETLGPEVAIANSPVGKAIQDVALDPQGSFVLYTTGKQILFQRLSSNGTPNGNPVELLSSQEFPLQVDIVRE